MLPDHRIMLLCQLTYKYCVTICIYLYPYPYRASHYPKYKRVLHTSLQSCCTSNFQLHQIILRLNAGYTCVCNEPLRMCWEQHYPKYKTVSKTLLLLKSLYQNHARIPCVMNARARTKALRIWLWYFQRHAPNLLFYTEKIPKQ